MKKYLFVILCFQLFGNSTLQSEEGMWLLNDLKTKSQTLYNSGLELTPEDIYSEKNPSIKDAVIIFDNGCTGEIVSENGLIFTNHHCGFQAIQKLSTVEKNHIDEGYWANSLQSELPCQGATIKFLKKFIDVTDSVLPFLDTCKLSMKDKIFDEISEKLTKPEKAATTEALIKAFADGNRYFLITYEVFKDIRLVGTPPFSVGKFGADTDNWMWPRHTGDFAVFRVYSDSASKPSTYNVNNIPLKTPNFLRISLKGYKPNDFTMILGFPGVTNRFLSFSQVNERFKDINPLRIQIRDLRQNILTQEMNLDAKTRIQYASKFARSSNYWKYYKGQNEAIVNYKVLEKIKERDSLFSAWALSQQNSQYIKTIPSIDSVISFRNELYKSVVSYDEAFLRSMEFINIARKFLPVYNSLNSNSKSSEIQSKIVPLQKEITDFYKDYNFDVDMKESIEMLHFLQENLPKTYQFKYLSNSNPTKISRKITKSFSESIFKDSVRLKEFLLHPKLKKLKKDPLFNIANEGYAKYQNLYSNYSKEKKQLEVFQHLYTKGLMIMKPADEIYPDANSTMRFTYGKVMNLEPVDAVSYSFQTTLNGVIEKHNPKIHEFNVPIKLQELFKNKDFGEFAENGKVPVAFITTNDITGGNSGSPVLNSKGELIGLAFDGNWQGLSGEFWFEPNYQRTIAVDIRYVLFIIDKFAGSIHIMNELKINPN